MRAPTADRLVALDRTYDPTTGTFLTPDPIDGVPGTPDEANPYDYVGNDPLNFTDPLGLCRITDAQFDEDGTLIGGTYVYEENTAVCEDARQAGGKLCGGDAWKGVYFYDWDPFNTISWDVDENGGCTVTQGNGERFGVAWEVGPCDIGGWRQDVANLAGGTWSTLSLGLGAGLADSRTCGASGWYTVGNAAGVLVLGGSAFVVGAAGAVPTGLALGGRAIVNLSAASSASAVVTAVQQFISSGGISECRGMALFLAVLGTLGGAAGSAAGSPVEVVPSPVELGWRPGDVQAASSLL